MNDYAVHYGSKVWTSFSNTLFLFNTNIPQKGLHYSKQEIRSSIEKILGLASTI